MQRITQQLLDQVHYNGIQWAQVFQAIDIDGSGQIRRSEFGQVLRDLGIKVAQSDLELLMERFDNNRDDKLDYEEFLLMVGERQVDDSISDTSEEENGLSDSEVAEVAIELDLPAKVRRSSLSGYSNNDNSKKGALDLSASLAKATATAAAAAAAATLTPQTEAEKNDNANKNKSKSNSKTKRSASPRKSASRNMKQNLRASNNERKKKRKDHEKKLKKNKKLVLLQKNIAQARISVMRGNGKVAPPPGINSRQELKTWALEIRRAGNRAEERKRSGSEKKERRASPTLMERHKEDAKVKANLKAMKVAMQAAEKDHKEMEEDEEELVTLVKVDEVRKGL